MPKDCPVCGTVNPDSATHCDCGYDLTRCQQIAVAGSGLPVSEACPACGGTQYRRVRPTTWVAFASDRVCSACNTRYTPPTPVWAGVLFIVAGLLLAGFGAFSIIIRLASGNPLELPAMACE